MFHYIWMFVVGAIVGAIATLIMPGSQHLGFFLTAALGMAGSLMGGIIARLISSLGDDAPFQPAGTAMSIIGALVLLYAWNHLAQ